jgi:guanine deaminase
VHRGSVEALFAHAQARGMRVVGGKCLMDRNVPANLRDSVETGIADTLQLAETWHGTGRLSVAITPRFAGSCSAQQLAVAGQLARLRPDLFVQSHVAESWEEVRWIAELYPDARSYLDVYDRVGLVRELSIYAHGIWFDDADRRRMAQSQAICAVCPSSNLFLGSGLFDFDAALGHGMTLALATDVGGGQSLSMLATMRSAHDVARARGQSLRAAQLLYWSTFGAAEALGWRGRVGSLEVGNEADCVLIDPQAAPLLARRWARAQSLEERLMALIVLGDDRVVHETVVAGRPCKGALGSVAPASAAAPAGNRRAELTQRFGGRMSRRTQT